MITIVLGAQYGGEGKGKVSAYLASQRRFAAVCRAGGVNCCHTVVSDTAIHRLRLLPTACVASAFAPLVVFGAGVLLHLPTLFEEVRLLDFDPTRILIDRRAGVVEADHVETQRHDPRYSEIGSTLTGTGYASAARALRKLRLAREFTELQPFLSDTAETLAAFLLNGESVLIEGHQALGLSNYHGDYPYCSSRDTTAAAHLSEVGLGPGWKLEIILVVKLYPTRNHKGSLRFEMSEQEVFERGIVEYGGGSWGVPNRRRRVGYLDLEMVKRACVINTATSIAVSGADYLDPHARGVTSVEHLSHEILAEVHRIEDVTGVPVRWVSTGPETSAMIELRPSERSVPIADLLCDAVSSR